MHTNKSFLEYFSFENIYRVITLLCLVSIMYLQSHFVTLEKFESHVAAQTAMEIKVTETLAHINTMILLLQHTDIQLLDHETRIRVVEKNQIDVMSRLSIEEKRNHIVKP